MGGFSGGGGQGGGWGMPPWQGGGGWGMPTYGGGQGWGSPGGGYPPASGGHFDNRMKELPQRGQYDTDANRAEYQNYLDTMSVPYEERTPYEQFLQGKEAQANYVPYESQYTSWMRDPSNVNYRLGQDATAIERMQRQGYMWNTFGWDPVNGGNEDNAAAAWAWLQNDINQNRPEGGETLNDGPTDLGNNQGDPYNPQKYYGGQPTGYHDYGTHGDTRQNWDPYGDFSQGTDTSTNLPTDDIAGGTAK